MRQYSEEFRADAVALCERGDRTLRQVAEDLGVSHWTVREWVRKKEMAQRRSKVTAEKPPAKESDGEKARRLEREVGRLKRENERLQQDREILKKAAAFFAKESE